MKRLVFSILAAVMVVGVSGCLKTRAQLREESEDREPARPIPVQAAQEVRPQEHYVIDEIKSELTRQLGRIEDLERKQKELSEEPSEDDSGEDLKKLQDRLDHLEQEQAELKEAIHKLESGKAYNKDAAGAFTKGKELFDHKNYEEALEAFGAYIKIPGAKRVEDATFFRGESYFNLKQYKKAIVEYSKFPEKYTHSPHMPEVLYKIGRSFEALGMKDDAKGFYQELVEKYPKSPWVKKIKKKSK